MKIPHSVCTGIVLLIALIPSCSIRTSTDLGRDLINSVDSTIADLGHNYAQQKVTIPILDGRSSQFNKDSIPAGLHSYSNWDVDAGIWNGDTAIPYFEFDTVYKFNNTSAFTVNDVYIKFSPLSTNFHMPDQRTIVFHVFLKTDTIKTHATQLLQRNAQDVYLGTVSFNARPDSTDSSKYNWHSDSIRLDTSFFFTAAVHDSIDTTNLKASVSCLLFKKKFKNRKLSPYLVPFNGAFSPLLRLGIAGLSVSDSEKQTINNSDSSVQARSSFAAHYSDFSVFEPAGVTPGSLTTMSSSDRWVTYRLDLTPLWKAMADTAHGKTYQVLQSALLQVPWPSLLTEQKKDSTANPDPSQIDSTAGRDSMYVLYYVTAGDNPPPSLTDSLQKGSSRFLPASTWNTDGDSLKVIDLDIRQSILRLSRTARPSSVFVILMPRVRSSSAVVDEWCASRWSTPAGNTMSLLSSFSFPK